MLNQPHIPVMLKEVVEAINPQKNGIYVDATFGAGGYSLALLNQVDCKVIAIDRDPEAVKASSDLQEKYKGRLTVFNAKYSEMASLVASSGYDKVDGIMFDIGVSSMQIDNAERGFSFSKKGPLDMRMSREGLSAQDVVNNFSEKDLANIIYQYGEEKASRRIAKAIVFARALGEITTTDELAQIIKKALPKTSKEKIDPATRTFQALRIYVNSELEELKSGLEASEKILKENGRLAVVTFHSLEDRIVKQFLNEKSGKQNTNRHLPETKKPNPSFSLTVSRPLKPSSDEINQNPRSRSAKLRFAIRTDANPIN